MPRTSPIPRHAGSFAPDEWRLLIRLPAEVMVAAIAAGGHEQRTVAEGLAGLDAIAAGRGSDSDLVRCVVRAIYSEPEEGIAAPVPTGEPGQQVAQVLAHCRRAASVLRAGADPADAAAYRHWVQQVAIRVCGAARSGGLLGLGAEPIADRQQTLLDDLAAALS